MRTYIVEDWVETSPPKPFGKPMDGVQATSSTGYFVKKKAVKVEDILSILNADYEDGDFERVKRLRDALQIKNKEEVKK